MFKQLRIWKSAFENEGKLEAAQRLSTALDAVRKNAGALGGKIAADFPNLTVHDVSHMDALWNVADILVDAEHDLNPLEIFVLGCAFYLHDAALCFDAYNGGQAGVRRTDVWKDANWRFMNSGQESVEAEKNADFHAIRALHAQQAEKIAYCNLKDKEDSTPFYIIEDPELRRHHGQLIGRVAASHHWDIRRVESGLQDIQTPVASLPSEWRIRPILLACILRCADAAQIDGTRAPEHLLQLLNASGVSLDHWTAQNRIGAISLRENSEKLLITSTTPFTKKDAAAWWVMYDTIQMVDRELSSSNILLARTYSSSLTLRADGVENNFGPKALSERIQTEGWEPTDATVKVGDVERVVGALGGQQLYGADDILAVVVRELVQNALDAVSARRVYDESFNAGVEVSVELIRHPETQNWLIRVSDKGVGMSSDVMLNALLDFGNSFWSSHRASEEFPGLQSKNAQFIGRFGIGFFSVFSIAESVRVYSRRFDAGLNEFRCLDFPNGLTLRPLHSASKPRAMLNSFSTIVEVEISPDHYSGDGTFEVSANHEGQENFAVSFTDFVSSMICEVRARLEIKYGSDTRSLQDATEFGYEQAKETLNRLTFNAPSVHGKHLIDSHCHRMRVIEKDGKRYGFAALTAGSFSGYHFVSSKTIGGLSTPHNRGTDSFVGWMECECRSAKRDTGEVNVPSDSLEKWLDDQISLFLATNPDPISKFTTAGHIESLGGDPRSVLKGLVVCSPEKKGIGHILLADLPELLKTSKFLVPVSKYGVIDQYARNIEREDAFVLYPHLRAGKKYFDANFKDGVPTEPNSLFALITEAAEKNGGKVTWERLSNEFESALGVSDALQLQLSSL